jgi:hypothetical protein
MSCLMTGVRYEMDFEQYEDFVHDCRCCLHFAEPDWDESTGVCQLNLRYEFPDTNGCEDWESTKAKN